MHTTLLIGIGASIFLIIGSALPDSEQLHPARLLKNQCFAVGNIGMIIYAVFRYMAGGSVFFMLLEAMMLLATVLMLVQAKESISRTLILIMGFLLSATAFFIKIDPETLIFVAGLTIVSVGFTSGANTIRRNALLALGSGLVALFSAIQHDPVFLWMNVFFALFSLYHVVKMRGFLSQKTS